MNRTTTCGFALLFCALAASTVARAEDKLPEQTAKATALVDALAKSDYAAAGKDFDDTMRKALPADKCKEIWQAVVKQVGAFQKRTGSRVEKAGKYDVVFVACKFEKLDLDVKVVFSAEKKVTGLSFRAARSAYDFKPPPYARPDSYRESEVVVGSGEWALPGTLTLPKGEGPFAAAVLVHGSGPHDRDETIGPNKPLRDLAWGLASQGVAVLRYEKRSHTHGHLMAKDKAAITPDAEVVEDALLAAAALRKHKEIDGRRVFVVGHSLGAAMAPRIGSRDPSLAGLALLAGNARPLEDLILEQMTYIYSLKGELSDEDKEALDKIKKQVARVKDPKLTADAPAAELPLGIPSAYWLALRSYDQTATAAQLKQPLFIAQGERDYQVTMADFEAWKKALASRRNVTFRSYPKLNHLFMEGENKAKPAEYEKAGHVSRELVDDLAAWIKSQKN